MTLHRQLLRECRLLRGDLVGQLTVDLLEVIGLREGRVDAGLDVVLDLLLLILRVGQTGEQRLLLLLRLSASSAACSAIVRVWVTPRRASSRLSRMSAL